MGIGIYMIVGYRGYAPFFSAATVMAAGVVPILLIPTKAADIVLGGEERVRRAFRLAPLLLTVGFLAGALETVPWGLLQVYAVDNKCTRVAALALPIFYWGQILLTFPIGWVADRTSKRVVLIVTSAAAIVCMVGLASLAQTSAFWAIIFLVGGITTATYTLGLAILGQRFESTSLVSVNAAFLACSAAGTILGPPIVGALMDRFGSTALPAALTCVSACIFLCAFAARLEWQARRHAPSIT